MRSPPPPEPIGGPEAFERATRDARYTQAAVILSAGAAVAGETEHIEMSEQLPLPDLSRMYRAGKVDLAEAADTLSVPTADYLRGEVGEITRNECSRLAHRLYDDPDPAIAAGLVEASLHSRDRLIRTAAAVAAVDTTGPREEVIEILEVSAQSGDPTIRDLARVALARVLPQHAFLARVTTRPMDIEQSSRPSRTAVLTHGTFASNGRWWRPGGSFYTYLQGLNPPLHLHDPSFRWSGAYSQVARDLASDQLVSWLASQNLNAPDMFGHSHGATVATLATQRGLELDRLVMLAWSVHDQWLPDLNRVNRVIDVRVRFDLVVIADRGGQRLPGSFRSSPKVTERIHGWFRHSDPANPEYWERWSVPGAL